LAHDVLFLLAASIVGLHMKKLLTILLLVGFMLSALAQPSRADAWHRDTHWGGDIHHFKDRDNRYWRAGHWWHGNHGGRAGWWWVVGNGWYFYPQPVYPAPNPFTPPLVVTAGPPEKFWYYCRHPAGYYPYVPECFSTWNAVPVR
jgi:hypothetical protein